jgi:hypothetical protein
MKKKAFLSDFMGSPAVWNRFAVTAAVSLLLLLAMEVTAAAATSGQLLTTTIDLSAAPLNDHDRDALRFKAAPVPASGPCVDRGWIIYIYLHFIFYYIMQTKFYF